VLEGQALVGNQCSEGVGDQGIGDPEGVEFIHSVFPKSEVPIESLLWSHGPGGLEESAITDRESKNQGGRVS